MRHDRNRSILLPILALALVAVVGVLLGNPRVMQERIDDLTAPEPHRLDAPVRVRAHGAFAFFKTQDGDPGTPVAWSPCEPVPYEVNPAGAPPNWQLVVGAAVRTMQRATGLRFRYDGTTDERDADRTQSGPLPVLVEWSDASATPDLAGSVAGLGGSSWTQAPGDRAWFTRGSVVLDSDAFDDLRDTPDGRVEMRAIVVHELGHVVGLAHVDDPRELMYGGTLQRRTLGPGDREGLARLGAVTC
ncbi:matrixin family metalloprotease [Nocardioides acrostichi]|uniref:Matrixin family metalloprotease n=1 Tax=Nocardioides acrostichi TaxID=2784339 RepID=A0A930YCR5_9ACTN|nr:matrixin family metalloprotease [Nocardioides acrostichi]MBF4161709.1 matrixin family metalloprotease [Nocardioides acrostichi]